MSFNTFSPTRQPDAPLDITAQPRLLQSSLGPADPAFQADGINPVLLQTSLKFSALIESEYTSIDTFMTTNVAVPFFWTIPDESNPRLWRMASRTRRALATTWEYEVTLMEQVQL